MASVIVSASIKHSPPTFTDNMRLMLKRDFSNHIVHCILTIHALGATPEEMQKVYDREASYQKRRYPIDENIIESLADRATFEDHLSQQPHYSNHLLFSQREIEAKGVKATLEEHLFANDEHSNRLFALTYNGQCPFSWLIFRQLLLNVAGNQVYSTLICTSGTPSSSISLRLWQKDLRWRAFTT